MAQQSAFILAEDQVQFSVPKTENFCLLRAPPTRNYKMSVELNLCATTPSLCGAGAHTHSSMYAWQALYQLSYNSKPNSFS